MIKYDISVVGEMMLTKLKAETNLSHSNLYRMRTVGLGTIIRHFEKVGDMMVDKKILRDFFENHHAKYYANNQQHIQRWRSIRRAAEMLIYFSKNRSGRFSHSSRLD